MRILLVLFASVSVGCDSPGDAAPAYENILQLDTAHVRLVTARDTIRLVLEIAGTAEQKTMGLMERRQLPENAGMLFLYDRPQPATAGFWMYRTRIPLDIAFLDSLGTIRSIRHMVPCEATLPAGCPTYMPDVPYHAALEVNAGFFVRHGVGVGHRLILADTSHAPGTAR